MSESESRLKTNPNSALYWLPATLTVAGTHDVNTPMTRVVEFDFFDAVAMLEGGDAGTFPWSELEDAVAELGYPVFLRTDLSSAKHDGRDAICIDRGESLRNTVGPLIHDAAQKMMRPSALLVREWVEIDAAFEAFGDLPIGVELRLFATPDDHLETHYYWPEESIEQPSLPDAEWKQRREHMASEDRPPWLGDAACTAARAANDRHEAVPSDQAWSVDFARDTDGQWWLIDMARAEDSWHPEGGLDR